MSRSIKQPIIKDRPRNFQKSQIYWRTIRRVINYTLRKFSRDVDEMILPKEKSIVLDFFSGSAGIAHAVFELVGDAKRDLSFILVQLPEQTDEKSEAY